jgi:hypothetical protein
MLSIRVRADDLAPRICPRCIARHRVAIPMYAKRLRARPAAHDAS